MGRTVLVVEDDDSLQEVLEMALESEGYHVVASRDGLEALDQLDRRLPALILLDLKMPRMDGPAFADVLQARGLRPAVPLLVLTGDSRARAASARLGAEGYLPKPFDLLDLLDEVARLAGCPGPHD